MKTFKINLMLFLCFLYFSIYTSAQFIYGGDVKTENNWKYGGIYATWLDTLKTRSFVVKNIQPLQGHSQVFGSYGGTGYPTYWNILTTWFKYFSPILQMPDTISLDCKFVSGINVKEAVIYIGVQDSIQYTFYGIQKFVPLNSSWKTLYWDMSFSKECGMKSIKILYLAFQIVRKDSGYVGADVMVDNFRSIDDTLGISIIDGFGDSTAVGISDTWRTQTPNSFDLSQNYPNPFNPSTKIKFTVPTVSYVSLIVFNSLGQEVQTLVSEEKDVGSYEVSFNASNLPSGIYFCKIRAGDFVETKKMILMK